MYRIFCVEDDETIGKMIKKHLEKWDFEVHVAEDLSQIMTEFVAFDPQLVLMDIRLVPQKRNPYFVGEESVSLYFEEEPIFSCLTAAACATEETESVSGDSYSFLETDDSVAMILSDGVGSGESAARDSGRIVDLTERILDCLLYTSPSPRD